MYNVGDKLLVLLKEDNSKHIVEISDVDKSNAEYPYEFKCLYAYYYNFSYEWVNTNDIEIIKKVTDSDIDAFRKENEIKFKLGDAVDYDGEEDFVELYDSNDEEYRLENDGAWVKEHELELIKEHIKYEIGDRILVKYDRLENIVKVINIDKDSSLPYNVECLYGDFRYFEDNWIDLEEVTIIKKVTDSDIDSFLKENDIKYKIGDEVYYDSKHQTILAYDFNDEEYLLNESKDWVSEEDFEDEDILKYSIDDIIVVEDNGIKSILQITNSDPSDNTYKVNCLYGNNGKYHCEWIDADIIKESLDSEELEDLLEDKVIRYRIGQYLFYKGERCKVSCYDSRDEKYVIELSNYREKWVAECDLLEHTFSVGDLVKIKNYPKTILKIDNLCDDGDIEVSCVVGSYGDIEKGYYRGNELESATQAEVDILQKDYTFKVGEKVLYGEDRTEDYIESIDTNKYTDLPYQLGESFDYVSDRDISKIDKKVEEVFVGSPIKDSKTGKVTLNWKTEEEVKKEAEMPYKEEVKAVEKVEVVKPRRRLLLG